MSQKQSLGYLLEDVLEDPQPRMFDPGPAHQGPLSVRQFMNENQWHGTNRGAPWGDTVRESDVPVHSGTLTAAKNAREGENAKYFPVRPTDVHPQRVDDHQANRYHAEFSHLRGQRIPGSVADTLSELPTYEGSVARNRENPLVTKRSVAYENEVEDKGTTSYVSAPGAFQTLRDTSNFNQLPETSRREHFTEGELVQQGVDFSDDKVWEAGGDIPGVSTLGARRLPRQPGLFDK